MTQPQYKLWDKFKILDSQRKETDWSAYMDSIKSQVLEGQTLQTKPLEENGITKNTELFQDPSQDGEQEDKTAEVEEK